MTLYVAPHLFLEKVNFGDLDAFFMSRFMLYPTNYLSFSNGGSVIISISSGAWDAAGYI